MLELNGVDIYYGNIRAVKEISLQVQEGELVALLGANGAGKTTTLRAISGTVRPRNGTITFKGQDLSQVSAHHIVGIGIAHCPEGRQVFSRLSVLENLMLGAFLRKDKKEINHDLEWTYTLFPILAERKKQSAGTLSGGEQQMLAIGRVLMSRPSLILFDEPSLGLAPLFVEKIFEVIQYLKAEGKTILLVEQNAYHALEVADRGYVLETGFIKLSGTAGELLANDDVKKAYLGG
ncbi:MAG: High-affinity branched-chain amino acid transport ATP-binding protein LivF [Firmicutes bacterium ADurb.Bin456]|nr:MAG: High-affinity branched-chain amino acid transport ATP-binding protein LivF [Firmicutes bacterium ADurb.Bin456]